MRHTLEHKYGIHVTDIMREMKQLDSMKTMSISPITFVKVLFNMVKDKRVLLIKLAEKIHSVRTIRRLPPEQQNILAEEAPLLS